MKRAKLSIPNCFGLLWWEKIGKSAKYSKLGIPNHFGLLWWEKMQNNQTQPEPNLISA